jgi:hypothetical protein
MQCKASTKLQSNGSSAYPQATSRAQLHWICQIRLIGLVPKKATCACHSDTQQFVASQMQSWKSCCQPRDALAGPQPRQHLLSRYHLARYQILAACASRGKQGTAITWQPSVNHHTLHARTQLYHTNGSKTQAVCCYAKHTAQKAQSTPTMLISCKTQHMCCGVHFLLSLHDAPTPALFSHISHIAHVAL